VHRAGRPPHCEAAANGGTATYTFAATEPGTYLYHSGTAPAVQVEMGLLGAIVVRPYGYDADAPTAYGDAESAYDREYLFVLSEMDPDIHEMVEHGDSFTGTAALGDYFSKYWFLNGRTGPDTMAEAGVDWLPTQPYNVLPRMHPGEKVLMRVISAGREPHPFHHHGTTPGSSPATAGSWRARRAPVRPLLRGLHDRGRARRDLRRDLRVDR